MKCEWYQECCPREPCSGFTRLTLVKYLSSLCGDIRISALTEGGSHASENCPHGPNHGPQCPSIVLRGICERWQALMAEIKSSHAWDGTCFRHVICMGLAGLSQDLGLHPTPKPRNLQPPQHFGRCAAPWHRSHRGICKRQYRVS